MAAAASVAVAAVVAAGMWRAASSADARAAAAVAVAPCRPVPATRTTAGGARIRRATGHAAETASRSRTVARCPSRSRRGTGAY